MKAPDIRMKVVDQTGGPSGFLWHEGIKIKLKYPDGTISRDMWIDYAVRRNLDAVVICCWKMQPPWRR